MKYISQHALVCGDLFLNSEPSEWGVNETLVRKKHRRGRKTFCGYVFAYFMMLVFLDIIENNVTFEFPTKKSSKAFLYVKCIDGDRFKKEYSIGRFRGIDFLASNFKGYQIYYQYHSKNFMNEKPVYISEEFKNLFYNNINQGKQYY